MSEKKLTVKEQLFITEYCIDFNGTRAAIAAGYSKKSACEIASENLRKPHIRKNVRDNIDEALDQGKIKLKRDIIERLTLIAFDDPEQRKSNEGEIISISYRDSLKALEILGKYITLFNDKPIVNVNLPVIEVKITGDKTTD